MHVQQRLRELFFKYSLKFEYSFYLSDLLRLKQ